MKKVNVVKKDESIEDYEEDDDDDIYNRSKTKKILIPRNRDSNRSVSNKSLDIAPLIAHDNPRNKRIS